MEKAGSLLLLVIGYKNTYCFHRNVTL